jgi:glutathione peroxidase-family protein
MPNVPLSTRIKDYGIWQSVSGDFGDEFLVLLRWDGSVIVYVITSTGMDFFEAYESLPGLVKKYPGFEILNPENANERYLPDFKPLKK